MKTADDFLDTFLNDRTAWDFGAERAVEAGSADTIAVDDAALLFRGDYVRDGADLVIDGGGARLVVHDYFGVPHRPKLVAPNGASLSDAVIEALARPAHGVQVAQAGAPPVSDASGIGRVQATTGSASVLRNGVSVALHTGDLVYKGDVVQTERASSVSIAFLDGTLFSVAASARMVLNDMVYQAGGSDNHSLFNLVQGSVSFVAGQVAKTGDMKVGTPVATMGIRGTAVRTVIESDDGTSRLSVMTEPPSEAYPDGHTGSFGVYDRDDPGRLLATVSDPDTVLVVHPAGSGDVRVESVPKTPDEVARENSLVRDMYQVQAEAPRLPVFTGPSTGGGTKSGTEPNLILTNPTPTPGSPGLPGVSEPGVPQPTGPTPPATGPQPFQEQQPSEPAPAAPGVPPLAQAVPGATPSPGSAPQQPVAQAVPDGGPPAPASVQTAPAPPQETAAPPPAPGPSSFVLAAQAGSVTQDGTLTGTGGQGVLAGTASGTQVAAAHAGSNPDSDLAGGSVTLTGRYGTLVLRADGSYVYRADNAAALADGEHGTDVFAITARSGAAAGTATLSIDVTGLNDRPVLSAVQPLAAVRADGGTTDRASGSAGFADPDLTDLHTASVNGAPAVSRSSGSPAPAGLAASLAGALTARADDDAHRVDFSFAAADRTFSFLSPGETLTLTYDLSVSDGHGGVAHTPVAVTVTGTAQDTGTGTGGGINRPPVLDGDRMITVQQGGTVAVTAADLHASDPDTGSAQLTYTITQDAHGSFTLGTGSAVVTTFTQADVDAGRVVYHHDGTAPGSSAESVAFTLSDGTSAVTGTLAVTVSGQNSPPTVTAAPGLVLAERAGQTGSATPDTASGSTAFADPNPGDTHTAAVNGAPTLSRSGGAALPGGLASALTGALTATADDGTHRLSYAFSAADRTFDFLAAGETLTASYDVSVSDDHGGTTHTPVTVTVTGTNDAPASGGDHAIGVTQGGTVIVQTADLGASDPDTGAAQLTYTITQDAHGSFTLGTGSAVVTTFTQADVDAGRVVYHHDGSAPGANPEQVTYTLGDGTSTVAGTLAVTVSSQNTAPSITTSPGLALTERAGQTGSATPDTASGSTAFADANPGDTHTAAVDGAPSLSRSSGAALPGGLASALTGALTATADDGTHRLSYAFSAADRTFDFLAAGETLTASYDVSVSDDHGGTTRTPVTVTVTGTNDAPASGGDHAIGVTQGGTAVVQTADLGASDPDTGAAQLTYTITQDAHGAFTLGTGSAVVTSFTQADVDAGRVIYHHDGTAPGSSTESVAFTLSDGTSSVTGTLAVTVTATPGPDANQDNVVRSTDDQSNDLPIPTEALLFNDGSGAVSVTNVVDRAPTGTSSQYVRSYSSSAVTVTGDANSHGDTGAFTYVAENASGQSGSAATVYVNVTTGFANPTVFGQGEDDVLVASRNGATTMIGGGGHDVFVFTQDYTGTTSMTTHSITDFSVANDAIDLPYLANSAAGAGNIADYVRVQGSETGGFDLYVRSDTAFVYFTDVAHFTAGTVHAGDHVTVIWHDHAVQVTAALGGNLSM